MKPIILFLNPKKKAQSVIGYKKIELRGIVPFFTEESIRPNKYKGAKENTGRCYHHESLALIIGDGKFSTFPLNELLDEVYEGIYSTKGNKK